MSGRSVKMGELLAEAQAHPLANSTVTGIASDSRNVSPGSLFFAVPGVKVDGMSFASQAIAAGAVAVVGEAKAPGNLPYIRVADVRRALAVAASRTIRNNPRPSWR